MDDSKDITFPGHHQHDEIRTFEHAGNRNTTPDDRLTMLKCPISEATPTTTGIDRITMLDCQAEVMRPFADERG
jgi:hypothetical protein